ncbi:MAG TPA: YqgE/AlgH family protein [Quisquiliibacterium sp.]|nr:MAG: YqgE/AlgH family protein [Burkholderiaceae bacterium]HOA92683.1 YqgE/AlgH family protein [Quisquiliibacterium sp.]
MHSDLASNLTNHFLLAMPGMADDNFGGTVVFVAEHGPKGALGLVINRPMELDLRTLFARIDLKLESGAFADLPVFFGGPVQSDRGFVLHQPLGAWSSTVTVGDDVGLTSSKDVLEAVAAGRGPDRMLVTLGYSGWGPGQLEDEIARNAWLTVPADPDVLFDVPVEQRVARAFGLLGIDPVFLSSAAGHA